LEKHPCYVFNSDPKGDQRYLSFQEEGPKGIMIKSIYCPSAQDYINDLNKVNNFPNTTQPQTSGYITKDSVENQNNTQTSTSAANYEESGPIYKKEE
jgi:hypothetical protein